MNEILKGKVLAEAIRIGDELYNKRIEDESGIFWETTNVHEGQDFKYSMRVSDSLYSGVSGILLFYIALYKVTNDKKYLEICEKGLRWIKKYIEGNDFKNYSFLGGKGGCALVFLKMNEISDGDYLEYALDLMKNCGEEMMTSDLRIEVLNGASGIILILLHLYNVSKEPWLIEKIEKYFIYILENTNYNSDGIHWDRNLRCIKSLCGLSHGVAGVGFTFLELGNYFNNPVFYFLAEQAFAYEEKFFDEQIGNWKDLRKSLVSEYDIREFKKAVKEKNYGYFYKEKFMNAWCHGAPGIGLTRLRAYELLKKDIYKKEFQAGLKNVFNINEKEMNNNVSFTLCHGTGGNLDLAIEGYKILKDEEIGKKLDFYIEKMLKIYAENNYYTTGYTHITGTNDEYSLFNGLAGVGYFYLRTIEPEKVDSILLPVIKTKNSFNNVIGRKYFEELNLKYIRNILIEKVFIKTLKVLNTLYGKQINDFLDTFTKDVRYNVVSEFMEFVESLLSKADKPELLEDIYLFEREKLFLDDNIKSYALANYRYTYRKEDVVMLLDDSNLLMNSHLQINPDVKVIETKWNWEEITKNDYRNLNVEKKNNTLWILIASFMGVKEIKTSEFCYLILECFNEKSEVNKVVEYVISIMEEDDNDNKNIIKQKVLEQVRELLKDGILILE